MHMHIQIIVGQAFEIIFSLRSVHMPRYTHTLRYVKQKLNFKRVHLFFKKAFQGPGITIIILDKHYELAWKISLFLVCWAARLQVSCVLLNELMSEKLKKTAFNYLHVLCSGSSSRVWRWYKTLQKLLQVWCTFIC